jgi:hypothetical protein
MEPRRRQEGQQLEVESFSSGAIRSSSWVSRSEAAVLLFNICRRRLVRCQTGGAGGGDGGGSPLYGLVALLELVVLQQQQWSSSLYIAHTQANVRRRLVAS